MCLILPLKAPMWPLSLALKVPSIFQLGREYPIPLSIRESLAAKLKIAAGNGWPIETLG